MKDFYPRCYDLRQPDEMEDFVQDYKQVKACNLLKIYVREMRSSFESGDCPPKSKSVSENVLDVAMKVCR